jgi:hypothetical protein
VLYIPGAGKKGVNTHMNAILTKLALTLLPILMANITPTLREHIVVFVNALDEKAKQTASPYDDMAVSVLKALLMV